MCVFFLCLFLSFVFVSSEVLHFVLFFVLCCICSEVLRNILSSFYLLWFGCLFRVYWAIDVLFWVIELALFV